MFTHLFWCLQEDFEKYEAILKVRNMTFLPKSNLCFSWMSISDLTFRKCLPFSKWSYYLEAIYCILPQNYNSMQALPTTASFLLQFLPEDKYLSACHKHLAASISSVKCCFPSFHKIR